MNAVRKASLLAFSASIIILAVKFFAYSLTQSTAVLSDALESIINVMAAGVMLILMKYVALPADENHPYGHGKLEYFSAAFEGGLIAFAGLVIAKEAIEALYKGSTLHNLDVGLMIATAAALMNLGLGFYVKNVGLRERSEALKASGEHILSDVWSTGGTLIGLALVRVTGYAAFDGIAAIAIAMNLSYSGYKILRRSAAGLVDEVHPETLHALAKTFNECRQPPVVDIHFTKVIRSGNFHHVDAHLVLPEFWSLAESHPFVSDFERSSIQAYSDDGEINFHIDPCYRKYCSHCSMEPCPVRKRPFQALRPFTADELTGPPRYDP